MEKRSKKMQRGIVSALEHITNWVRALGSESAKTDTPSLLPLTPKFDPERHGMYVEVIEAALGSDDTEQTVRNLALTGSYGVGKSSILEEVRRQHGNRVIAISLSTLGFFGDESGGGIAATKTNRIQKEIVKQLLYSEDPVKMPGSRYHRVSRFRFWREVGLALLIAVPLTVTFFLLGWTASIGAVLPLPKEFSLVTNVVVFAGLTLLLLGLRFVSYNRIHISQLTAGKATIALSPQSATYFDEYLDEIVYFFEKVDCDLVIFEDIDRFDDAHIFETLRSLNSILNGAKQLRGRPIRFIYAIKDSIFDQLGVRAAEEELSTTEHDETDEADPNGDEISQVDAAEAEVARANRTKFFDLVVPVVPFITHRSARDLLVEKMKDLDHKVSLELIDLAARHVADMRLIKNVRNEFAIFKRQIIDKGSLQLTQTGLFAMMLYKSTHLSDFELIRLGKSNLDTSYQASRDLVNQSMKSLNTAIAKDRRAMQALQLGTGRGAAFGTAFANRIAQVMTYLSGTSVSYQYQGSTIADAELLDDALWVKVADAQDAITVNYRTPSYGQQSFNVDHGQLAEIIGDSLSTDAWKKAERKRLAESIASATSQRDFLASADMRDLMAHPEYKVVFDRKEMTFEQVVCSTLKSDLAIELVRAGHIDRNYTLYTSTFYAERVSANAMNFMIKSVDPQLVDMAFELKPNDVRAVLRERPEILQQRAAHNISLLNYLLEKDSKRADALIARLVNYADEQRDFVHAYLETGTNKVELIQGLASRWGGVYKLLVSEASLPDEERICLVDVALKHVQSTIDYTIGEDVRSFLGVEYRSLTSFTSDAITPDRAALLTELLVKSALWLADLEPLGASVREAVVGAGVYKITNMNLVLALGSQQHSLSLDAIQDSDEAVYLHMLDDIPSYLEAIAPDAATVVAPDKFATFVIDIHTASPKHLDDVIARASEACKVDLLTDVPADAWPYLAKHDRFPAKFKNIDAYIDESGVDSMLAAVLMATTEIAIEDDDSDASKLKVALVLLGSKSAIPSAEHRANLVRSLQLDAHIPPSSVPKETGELVGWLIANNELKDGVDAFTALAPNDLDGLAFAISKSEDFVTYMTTTEVVPADVGRLVNHSLVPTAVKDAIIDRIAEFTVGASATSLWLVGNYAARIGKQIPFSEVQRFALEGVDAPLVVKLLQPHLAAYGAVEISSVLDALEGNYSELTKRSGKHPRFIKDDAHQALAERLRELDIVSSITDRSDYLVVNMLRS